MAVDDVSHKLGQLEERTTQMQCDVSDLRDDFKHNFTLIHAKLDGIQNYKQKVDDCAEGVADYRGTKKKALGLVAGLGLATGAAADTIREALSNLFR